MKLIALTDFWHADRTEYLDPSLIARIEKVVLTNPEFEYIETARYLFGLVKTHEKRVKDLGKVEGSCVYLKGSAKHSNRTYVRELPEEIIAKVKNKEFVLEA